MKITEILLIYAYIVICIESIKKVGFVNMSTKRECRDNVCFLYLISNFESPPLTLCRKP